MVWLAVLAAVVFGALYFWLRRSLKETAKALREIEDADASRRLRLPTPDRNMEELTRQVNRLLEEKQQAETAHRRAEQERRGEIANISHDLRTPLTSILGYLQLAQEDCSPEERQDIWRSPRAGPRRCKRCSRGSTTYPGWGRTAIR